MRHTTMSESSIPLRLLALWRRRGRTSAPEYEPADLGTAFGLDLSMLPEDAPEPAQPTQAATWWQRRSQRATG